MPDGEVVVTADFEAVEENTSNVTDSSDAATGSNTTEEVPCPSTGDETFGAVPFMQLLLMPGVLLPYVSKKLRRDIK